MSAPSGILLVPTPDSKRSHRQKQSYYPWLSHVVSHKNTKCVNFCTIKIPQMEVPNGHCITVDVVRGNQHFFFWRLHPEIPNATKTSHCFRRQTLTQVYGPDPIWSDSNWKKPRSRGPTLTLRLALWFCLVSWDDAPQNLPAHTLGGQRSRRMKHPSHPSKSGELRGKFSEWSLCTWFGLRAGDPLGTDVLFIGK